jgi:hypothetical protein
MLPAVSAMLWFFQTDAEYGEPPTGSMSVTIGSSGCLEELDSELASRSREPPRPFQCPVAGPPGRASFGKRVRRRII